MRRLPFMAAAAITLVAATPVVGLIATPAAAQGWRGGDRGIGDGELRELLREFLMDRGIWNVARGAARGAAKTAGIIFARCCRSILARMT